MTLPVTVANLAKPTRYIPVTETAKMIRQALKEAYPEVKFSVRTDKYAGGSSIRIRYEADILAKDVERIAKTFQGGSFDGMTDCKGYLRHTINGEPVSFGGDFVFVDRDIDDAKKGRVADVIQRVIDRDGMEALISYLEGFGLEPMVTAKLISYHSNAGDFARALLHAQVDEKFAGRRSKLAESVTFISDSNDHENAL